MSFKPVLAVTMGDPSGVGPEILVRALSRPSVRRKAKFVVFGDYRRLLKARGKSGNKKPFPFIPVGKNFKNVPVGNKIPVIDFKNIPPRLPWGQVSRKSGRAAGEFLAGAVDFLKKNPGAGLVTLPINKVSIQSGAWKKKDFGHTEFLARVSGRKKVRLMMVKGPLRVVHVTSHLALSKVAGRITRERVLETIELAKKGCQALGFKNPRIAVCALNPHGGEGGLFGKEEARFISPAVAAARKKRIRASGPFPADSLWSKAKAGLFDGIVAMYHDQGQIPIKLEAMEYQPKTKIFKTTGVNMTLGLPFTRVSVAHGTAFDIAGKGLASEASLIEAIDLAKKVMKRGNM